MNTCTHAHTHLLACTHMNIHWHVHALALLHVLAHTQMHKHIPLHDCARLHLCTHEHIQSCWHTFTYRCMSTLPHMCLHKPGHRYMLLFICTCTILLHTHAVMHTHALARAFMNMHTHTPPWSKGSCSHALPQSLPAAVGAPPHTGVQCEVGAGPSCCCSLRFF